MPGTLHDDQGIALQILGGDEPRCLETIVAPPNVQPGTLSERVERHALMLPDLLACRSQYRTSRCSHMLRKKLPERALANKADSRAVPLGVVGKPKVACKLTNRPLVQRSQREEGPGQRFAVNRMEKIGLILVAVGGPEQARRRLQRDAGVVPGCNPVGTEPTGVVQKHTKLDVAIAGHIRIGRTSGANLSEEPCEDLATIFAREVDEMEPNAKIGANLTRISKIPASGAVLIPVVPIGHVQRFDPIAGLKQAQRRNCRVDPA